MVEYTYMRFVFFCIGTVAIGLISGAFVARSFFSPPVIHIVNESIENKIVHHSPSRDNSSMTIVTDTSGTSTAIKVTDLVSERESSPQQPEINVSRTFSSTSVNTGDSTQTPSTYTEEIVALINQATNELRQKESLAPFTTDRVLRQSAERYSAKLLTDKYLAHVDKNGCDLTCRFSESKYIAQSWGENLAMIQYDKQPTAEYVANFFVTHWLKSAGHRKNILSPEFTHQGIGISADSHSVYATVHFAFPI